MAEQTVQDRYHQLVDSVSDLVSGSTTSLTTIELALDDMLLKLKLWGLDVGEANGTLQNIDEKDPLLAGIIRDVFESLSEAIHALRTIPEDPPPATESNLSDIYFSNAFEQLDEIAENITRKDTQESDVYISQFVRQIFEANVSGNEENTLAFKSAQNMDRYSLTESDSEPEHVLPSTEIDDEIESWRSGCSPPRTYEWCTSNVIIKDGQGLEQPEKLVYDTGSVANISTLKFASVYKLKERPVLPEEVATYATPIGPVTPLHYIELQIKDPKHGINDFVQVRFMLVETLSGFGLMVGRGFMTEHQVKLDLTKSINEYPVISRAPGPAAIEDRHEAHLKATEVRERQRVYKTGESSSTAESITKGTGTSGGENTAGSSSSWTSGSILK